MIMGKANLQALLAELARYLDHSKIMKLQPDTTAMQEEELYRKTRYSSLPEPGYGACDHKPWCGNDSSTCSKFTILIT